MRYSGKKLLPYSIFSCPGHSTANFKLEKLCTKAPAEVFLLIKRKSNNIIILMDTSITHLTLKCFVSNSHLDIRTGFAATLLCRLLENKREGCQPIRPTTAHNAESSVTDNIIAPKLKHQLLEARYQAHNGERVYSSREGTLPYDLTSRAAGRGATKETAKLCLLCFLILACWVLTAKYYSGLLTE